MSKVFKIGQDVRETEYLICLWISLLNKAEAANRSGQGGEVVLNYVRGLLRSISAQHQVFVNNKYEEEKEFVKNNINKPIDLSFEGLKKFIITNHLRKSYRKCVRLILLYVLKVDKLPEGQEKESLISGIVTRLEDQAFIKELLVVLKELLQMVLGIDRQSTTEDLVATMGTVFNWFTSEGLKDKKELFSSTLLDVVTHYIVTDHVDIIESLSYLKPNKSANDLCKLLIVKIFSCKKNQKLEAS